MNNALRDWLLSSDKVQVLKKNTLTEVTDSYDSHVIAYIVPLTERTQKGLYTIKVLWTSDRCSPSSREQSSQKQLKYWLAGAGAVDVRYEAWHGTNSSVNLAIFNAVGLGTIHVVIPYHDLWIYYKPIPKRTYPIYMGMSNNLDGFIAQSLRASDGF